MNLLYVPNPAEGQVTPTETWATQGQTELTEFAEATNVKMAEGKLPKATKAIALDVDEYALDVLECQNRVRASMPWAWE